MIGIRHSPTLLDPKKIWLEDSIFQCLFLMHKRKCSANGSSPETNPTFCFCNSACIVEAAVYSYLQLKCFI